MRTSHGQLGRNIEVVTRISVPYLDLQGAIACGLIVNELTTNAFKYAFEGRENGTILIMLGETTPGQLQPTVQDDGRGMFEGESRTTEGFGLSLVRLLAEQIGGRLEISSGPGLGRSVTFAAGDIVISSIDGSRRPFHVINQQNLWPALREADST